MDLSVTTLENKNFQILYESSQDVVLSLSTNFNFNDILKLIRTDHCGDSQSLIIINCPKSVLSEVFRKELFLNDQGKFFENI